MTCGMLTLKYPGTFFSDKGTLRQAPYYKVLITPYGETSRMLYTASGEALVDFTGFSITNRFPRVSTATY